MFKKSILTTLLIVGLLSWFGAEVSVRAQGAAESAAAEPAKRGPDSLFSIVFSGGPVGITIMLVLFAVSFTAAYLVFEHMLTIRRKEIMPEGLGEQVRQCIIAGNLAQADQLCRAKPSFLSAVLVRGLGEVENGWSEVEKALEESLAEQAARLFRKIEYLAVIGNIAPMLGLLGTVTGMILAFQQVANTEGSAGAADLAQGIYSALVTTVAGLTIAIPSLAALAVFRNRVDQFVAEAAYLAQHAFAPLKRRSLAPAMPTAPPPPMPSPPAVPGRR
ncbi:MAG TPA: MotA/TolQ/ExbB proton channel family protein, partial [Pirellulaceae bacterium]|nr:MotA/TolQ/ExbB proton channel family protein [Pirellulaceae bacterium]